MGSEFRSSLWETHRDNPLVLAPFLTFASGLLTVLVGSVVAWAALRPAKIARLRHEEQTKADLQRRITENIARAVEQLGSDKLQVRLAPEISEACLERDFLGSILHPLGQDMPRGISCCWSETPRDGGSIPVKGLLQALVSQGGAPSRSSSPKRGRRAPCAATGSIAFFADAPPVLSEVASLTKRHEIAGLIVRRIVVAMRRRQNHPRRLD